MKISELIDKTTIISDLKSTVKADAIRELSEAISQKANAPAKKIAEVLMGREELGSTGIGGGIAIPHGKLDLVNEIIVGFGLSRDGVEYDSLDKRPVHIFFLLLTPENSTGGHLKVLAQISKLLKMDQFKNHLMTAESNEEIYKIIAEQDEEF